GTDRESRRGRPSRRARAESPRRAYDTDHRRGSAPLPRVRRRRTRSPNPSRTAWPDCSSRFAPDHIRSVTSPKRQRKRPRWRFGLVNRLLPAALAVLLQILLGVDRAQAVEDAVGLGENRLHRRAGLIDAVARAVGSAAARRRLTLPLKFLFHVQAPFTIF